MINAAEIQGDIKQFQKLIRNKMRFLLITFVAMVTRSDDGGVDYTLLGKLLHRV